MGRFIGETKRRKGNSQEGGKMESLMFDCKNWGREVCHPDVSKYFIKESIKEKEEPEWPDEEKLAKLDEICKTCEYLDLQPK